MLNLSISFFKIYLESCFKIGTEFVITKKGILGNGKFTEKIITGEEGIIIGNEKGGKADIPFSANFKSISREHLKIIYKDNFGEKSGFYLLDLGKSITSFVVEDKPYILAKNLINLSSQIFLTVKTDFEPMKILFIFRDKQFILLII